MCICILYICILYVCNVYVYIICVYIHMYIYLCICMHIICNGHSRRLDIYNKKTLSKHQVVFFFFF